MENHNPGNMFMEQGAFVIVPKSGLQHLCRTQMLYKDPINSQYLKKMKKHATLFPALCAFGMIFLTACDSDDDGAPLTADRTLTIENVLDAKPLVQSGTFANTGDLPVYLPGESFSLRFSAGKGQTLSFVTMYGWSNDLFFAPENPGISLYDNDGMPIEGDVSGQIRLWDNGTRINQHPGAEVIHPGTAESSPQPVTEITGTDTQGNTYVSASELMNVELHYEGNSVFTVTVTNTSGDTANPTPFSPGVWAVSYIAGGELLDPAPLYQNGIPAANGITDVAENGDPSALSGYTGNRTGIFTPLSPILVVIYNGISNPVYEIGAYDAEHGLSQLAQTGDAGTLSDYLQGLQGVKSVYILSAEGSDILLPGNDEQPGGKVSQQLRVSDRDKIAMATMYGFSNDWFFAIKGDIDAAQTGDISSRFGLFDNGTAVDQFPGAGHNQVNLGGVISPENKPISEVPNPNPFTTLPATELIIKATIQ
ncbi:hypothetical protein SAMN02927921_00650 [Sinomicrobium oceani]|uniref:Spondin_N n=1 Tax=Sinomicrobium oceani TaxID=1150368 RepID=A0A1K1MMI8_9FLAO|nr:spondin domain-containing protein [Sinomicrobium oceani]SFW24307.1 hypothetical protein SAMN02927921_00650 [Sinomicrobium oceani]